MTTKEQMAKAIAAKKADPSIGRPRLMAITGWSNYEAQKFLKKHGGGWRPNGKGPAVVQKKEAFAPGAEPAPVEGGICLSPATRVLERKPPVTVRSKFFSLPKNRAFKIADLARPWGFSAETVKRHAKDEGCFAYIDVSGHDDFEECVMHPETAASRLKG